MSDEYMKLRELASNESTPKDVLIQMATHSESWVREAVAGNRSTPPEVLVKLAEDYEGDIRDYVAGNPATPIGTVMELAGDKELRWMLARNPNLPVEMLAKLADSKWGNIRYGVAQNPSTPAFVLEHIANTERGRKQRGFGWDDFELIESALACHPNTPPHVLGDLIERGNGNVAWDVCLNPNAPVHALEYMAEDIISEEGDHVFIAVVARHPRTPVHFLEEFYKLGRNNSDVLESLASNPSTPSKILSELAKLDSEAVLIELARNMSSPVDVLSSLAQSKSAELLEAVLRNPNATSRLRQEIKERIAPHT